MVGLPEDYTKLLVDKGVQLAIPGLSDIALQREDALFGVTLLRRAAVPILGGDVYLKRGRKIDLAYANWYADRMAGEQESAYFHRSWDSTEQYIREFPEPEGADPLFVLVTGGR